MAYGAVPRPAGSSPANLRPRLYPLPAHAVTPDRAAILTIPFHAQGQDASEYIANGGVQGLRPTDKLIGYLHAVFNAELALGITYPQREALSREEFASYYLSHDLIVAFFLPSAALASLLNHKIDDKSTHSDIAVNGVTTNLPSENIFSLSSLDPETSVAGFYYIKPNYPGRSSHNCNAGFVVPPTSRGTGLGGVLGRSYLHYGPRAGYRASVFNLVYANNQASLRIWDRLGFTRIGVVPEAGLLKRSEENGGGEEYVDAYAIYKKFDPVEE